MFYCLVVGSRGFSNYSLLKAELDKLLINQQSVTVVSGYARGADTLAERYAYEKGYEFVGFPAEWGLYGRSAGIRRNDRMQQYIAQFDCRGCVAFWDGHSRGTQSNFEMARRYGNPLRIVRYFS